MDNEKYDLINTYAGGLLMLPLQYPVNGHCSCRRPDCRTPAKHPLSCLVPHGLDDATADLDTVRGWFRVYPQANIGIRPPKGVIVLDVDPRNGGQDTLAELESTYGRLPATLTARTGGGGLHLWFGYSGPSRGRLGPGLDVKSHSGFLVAPPSVHVSGRRYEWINQTRTAWAPGWLAELLDPPVRLPRLGATGSACGLLRVVAEAEEGNRNNVLHWAACRAVESGLEHVLEELTDAAIAGGQNEHEARATVASAARVSA